jgi:Double-GTPase 2
VSAVYCPICEHEISNWAAAKPYGLATDGTAQRLEQGAGENEDSWQSRLTMAYRPCKDDITQPETHFLPWDYAEYMPVIIGMIGQSRAGKTHLLAAMIYRLLDRSDLAERVGIKRVAPLDIRVHQRYEAEYVNPLIVHRRELPGTSTAARAFCDALKVTNSRGQSFSVLFFDLAGENLTRPGELVRFYARANALLFVIDAAELPKQPGQATTADPSFDVALKRVEKRPKPSTADLLPIAASLVVAKADLLEFDDAIPGDWLAAGSLDEEADLSTVERESEDVYMYLTRLGASRWLDPAKKCHDSTLHFASATNSSATNQGYPPFFRQRRVLKPLLSVFAMTGIIDDSLLRAAPRDRP